MFGLSIAALSGVAFLVVLGIYLALSVRFIFETELGVVSKNIAWHGLTGTNAIAFKGEGGYQAVFLKAGVYFYPLFIYSVRKQPLAQVPPGEIALVYAQVGAEPTSGSRTVADVGGPELFADLQGWLTAGGRKGIQRQVLPPGSTLAVHPVAFLIITKSAVFGIPIEPKLKRLAAQGKLDAEAFDIDPELLQPIEIRAVEVGGKLKDAVGVVYTRDGAPLPAGAMAGRLGGFEDLKTVEDNISDAERAEMLLRDQLSQHNSFQDFGKFIDLGGANGMQFDVLRPGTYNLNPAAVRVEIVPMLEVSQGQVAVVKAYEGLATRDISGATFKFGSLVRPGHKGVWAESLRTGKYLLNPHLFAAEIVPTSIVNLNWADNQTSAHQLDKELKSIHAKSKDGFDFSVGLVVQIHIPDTLAPRVISAVGTVASLVNDVLQAAVGNYVRDTIQSMQAVEFIEKRETVQSTARNVITERLKAYDVECVNVLIQDVIYPQSLTDVLQERTIAVERKTTFTQQKAAETERIEFEKQKGIADQQAALAQADIGVTIAEKNSAAQTHQAKGAAAMILETGKAEAAKTEAIGLALAAGFKAQAETLGPAATALTNMAKVFGENNVKLVPEILSVGGEGGMGGLIGTLTGFLQKSTATPPVASTPETAQSA